MPELGAVNRAASLAQLWLALYALAGGLTSFIGYAADVPRLTDWLNSGISIQPNATIAVMSAGLAILLLRAGHRWTAAIFGALVAIIGATVLFEHATGIDLRIDALVLFDRTWGRVGVIIPGRMGPPGGASWTLLGVAIALAAMPRQRPQAWAAALALVAMTIGSLSLIGYLYGASALYTLPTITIIALQTATFVLAVSIGVALSVPDRAPVRLITDPGPAGELMRRILPAVIVIPIALGLLRLWGEQGGLYDLAFGTAIRTLTEIALLSGLLWWAADAIGRQARARQLAEEQLVESLRDTDRRKNKFLATLAHELRNPLAPVLHAAALMRRRGLRDPEIDRVSDVIERQVGLMGRLMDDLLDIGRITNDRLELRKQRGNLATIVRDAVEMSRPLIQQSEHEINIVDPESTILVEADPARLGQVFGNLVNNACRYSPPRSHIWISMERKGANAVVTVTDTGNGIPAAELSNIFDMFSQVDRTHRPHGGLGIGLHLVQRLVEMHGGSVTAHSEGPGLGSRFTVRLPALPESAVMPDDLSTPAPEVSAEPHVARKVLVVDDNTDNAELLAILLQELGHETYMAHDGVEGLAAAERFRPDVVLLDLGLPRIDGFEACRRIREHAWGKHVLMVAITGWGQDVDRRKSAEAGFDHHLVKPVDARAITALMANSKDIGTVRVSSAIEQ